MNKMREAFFKYYGVQWGVSTNRTAKQNFEAGYQAAIADVKAGGAVAVLDGNGEGEIFFPCDAMYHYWYARNGIALYKLPEDV